MRVLDSCRIRWGRILSIHSGQAKVSSQPLHWTGGELALGRQRIETAQVSLPIREGDTVALHWDWVCDVLDAPPAG
jgi:hypothetical protein